VQPVVSASAWHARAALGRDAIVTWLAPTAAAAVLGFVAVMVLA